METLTAILLLSFIIVSLALMIVVSIFSVFLNIIPVILRGAFFAQSNRKEVERMISLSNIRPGDKAVDLGSGDGVMLIALARAGAQAHGYEINPILVWWSRYRIKKAGLSSRAFVYCKNFWNVDLSSFNVVFVFGIKYMMEKLEKKLKKELKPGTRIASNYFTFPTWKSNQKEGNAYLYKID